MFLLLDHAWAYLKYWSLLQFEAKLDSPWYSLPPLASLHSTFLPPWMLSSREESTSSVPTWLSMPCDKYVCCFNIRVLPSSFGRQLRAMAITWIVLRGSLGQLTAQREIFVPGHRHFIWPPVASTLTSIIFFFLDYSHILLSIDTWAFFTFPYTINK